jgi:plasmid replication initiation protein
MRVLLACLMQVKGKDELDSKQNFIVTANALSELTGIVAGDNYGELKKAAHELSRMVITVKNTPEGMLLDPWDEAHINVTSSCRYYKNEGKVSLRFNDEIVPYISSLKTRFTQYQARFVMPMKSSYGIRLYELCLQWLGDEREFTVDDFKRIFGLEKKYPRLEQLKRRVIQPALDDINTYSDIRVEFGQRKTGRIVSHLQFMIVKKRPEKVKLLPHREWIEKNQKARAGEDWNQAIKRTNTEYLKYKKTGE